MSLSRDNTVDLAAVRRAKARLREIVVRLTSGETRRYSLIWPADKRLVDLPGETVAAELVAAELRCEGELIPFEALANARLQSFWKLVKILDEEMMRQDLPQEVPPPVADDAPWFGIELMLSGEWRTLTMRPPCEILERAAGDPVEIRSAFLELGLTLDGYQLALWQLCEFEDAEILAISEAVYRTAIEAVAAGAARGN